LEVELMRSDNELRQEVERELEWEPSLDERHIGVAVVDGVVTVTGEVDSFAEKWQAERTVERVAGVRGIANELTVRSAAGRTDSDIAHDAVHLLESNVLVPSDDIQVRVVNGWVTLTGNVHWDYQRRAADRSIRNLRGVRGITNLIAIRPRVDPKDVKKKIEETFERQAILDARHIVVQAVDGEVTLRGSVRSWAERRAAEKAAWAAPGVTQVHNYVTVDALAVAAA
jgi:osmotically-inducible protein OsmY